MTNEHIIRLVQKRRQAGKEPSRRRDYRHSKEAAGDQGKAKLDSCLLSGEDGGCEMNWTKVTEGMPKPGHDVLAVYQSEHDERRIIKAVFFPRFCHETDNDVDVDYDPVEDTYFYREGWYEVNEASYTYTFCWEGITHWQELPGLPENTR
jgi:hypothetical protein